MHVMRDTEAWLSWLEHTVHIREVTGSSPVASTTREQKRTYFFARRKPRNIGAFSFLFINYES